MRDAERLVKRTPDGGYRYKEGRWYPAWAMLLVPFMLLGLILRRFVGKSVDWKAALGTVLVFETLLLPAESHSLKRGHWVYNESRILGPRIFGVPIEEPALYYLFSPLIIILIFHGYLQRFGGKPPENRI
jgi:lycopene cyclase domain-containing protein